MRQRSVKDVYLSANCQNIEWKKNCFWDLIKSDDHGGSSLQIVLQCWETNVFVTKTKASKIEIEHDRLT